MALSKRYYSVNGEMLYEKGVSRVDYLPDALGSVTATTTPGSPSTVENTYRMKPYGSTLVKTGAGADPRFRWLGAAGYRRTNLFRPGVYVRARHYSQEDGRWTTVDPLWPQELSYGYCINNPSTRTDPSGKDVIFDPYFESVGNTLFTIIGKTCPDYIVKPVQHFCKIVLAGGLDSLLPKINACIKASTPRGLHCQEINPKRLRCLKNFCDHGHVTCFSPNQDEAGYTLPSRCPSNEEEPYGVVHISTERNPPMGLDTRSQNPTGVFIHEVLHACGMAHIYTGTVGDEDEWVKTGTTCNNIAACCVINVLFDKGALFLRQGRCKVIFGNQGL